MKRRFARVTVGVLLALTALGNLAAFVGADPLPVAAPGTLLRVAGDGEENLFISQAARGRVWKLSPRGVLTLFQRGMRQPTGVAADAAGNDFIADNAAGRVRRVSRDGTVSNVAGTGVGGFSGDGGLATQARLGAMNGLAVDRAGNLFIADQVDNRVRKVTPDGIITTIAGNGAIELSGVGGPAASAGVPGPGGLAVDAAGNLFIASTGWNDAPRQRPNEYLLQVVGAAAPGLIAGKPFPRP